MSAPHRAKNLHTYGLHTRRNGGGRHIGHSRRDPHQGTQVSHNQARPNILLIVPDSHRGDSLGCSGNPSVLTPHLDQLAREGVRFTQAITPCAPCMPSRASIMTGRYMRSHGLWMNGVSLPKSTPTLGALLLDQGYATAAFGKMHLMPEAPQQDGADPYLPPEFGFQHAVLCEDFISSGPFRRWLARAYPELKDVGRRGEAAADKTPACYASALPLEAHPVTWITDQFIEWLSSLNDSRPFLAVVGFHEPHYPFCPPEPFLSQYDQINPPVLPRRNGEMEDKPPSHRARLLEGVGDAGLLNLADSGWQTVLRHYYGQISLVDHAVGRMLKAIDQCGRQQQTLVIYTSDHGVHVGDHGLLYSSVFHYDGFIRVPLLMRWPEVFPACGTIEGLVQSVDVSATILAAAGVPGDAAVQGMDLRMAAIEGQATIRDAALVEQCNGRFDPTNPQRAEHWVTTLRTDQYRLSVHREQDLGELYDLHQDPHEFVNLWNQPQTQAVKAALLHRLSDLLLATSAPLAVRVADY